MQKSKLNEKTSKPQLKVPEGHVSFRILSSQSAAKAVIGHGGATQKRLLQQTSAWRIVVSDAIPGCGERIVYVIGTGNVDRTVTVEGAGKFQVSAAQAALVRVFETIAAAETAAVRKCRFLVAGGDEVWKRELELKIIEKDTCAFVRVLPVEELPPCVDLSDDLILITGASLAVKKALIAVTHCLQGGWKKLSRSHPSTSSRPSRDLQVKKNECYMIEKSRDGNQSLSPDADTREVVFRLICPVFAPGGLNGWEETVIKNLEKETGASILVLPPAVGSNEFVVTVSATENMEWKYSPAQNAAACVFIRSMEDGARSGHGSGGNSEGTAKAKLLVKSDQLDGVDLTSSMQNTEVEILDNHLSRLASPDEKIVQECTYFLHSEVVVDRFDAILIMGYPKTDSYLQIVGELSDVHVCLFQVTWSLRDKVFSSKLATINRPLLPHEILGRPPSLHQSVGITEAMDELVVSEGVNDQPKSKLSSGEPLTVIAENQVDCDAVTSGTGSSTSELGSEDGVPFIRNTEVEIVIPANLFGRVYGKDGCNMARIRQVTGARVIIHDPSPGTEGRAIISGTLNRTQAAMSMLWAFINEK